jgi:hypothetical protein
MGKENILTIASKTVAGENLLELLLLRFWRFHWIDIWLIFWYSDEVSLFIKTTKKNDSVLLFLLMWLMIVSSGFKLV